MDFGGSVLFPKNARQRLGGRRCLYLILFEVREAEGRGAFRRQHSLIEMISPSFPRNAVRGFWPGLGAKSWAFAGIAAIPCRALLVSSSLEISRSYADKSVFLLQMTMSENQRSADLAMRIAKPFFRAQSFAKSASDTISLVQSAPFGTSKKASAHLHRVIGDRIPT